MAIDYSKKTKEELIQIIEEQKKQLSSTKYGLYWDKEIEEENVVTECKTKIPYLKRIEDKCIFRNERYQNNVIIEGDNFHALTCLNMIKKGTIDLIYIDPPYNTGSDSFVYSDKYVNDDDYFRHSKWISFINKRLLLARELLSDDGFIFVSIDDNEQANLKLLLDQVFGEQNFVCTFIIDKTAQGANQSSTFKQQHEYCLLYTKSNSSNLDYDVEEENDAKYKYEDEIGKYAITNSFDSINSPLTSNKNRGYTVYYNEITKDVMVIDEYDKTNNVFKDYDKKLIDNGYVGIRPGIRKGVQYPWNWSLDRFYSDYKKELVFCKNKKGNYFIYHKNRFKGKTKDTTIKRFDTRHLGNEVLIDILGDKRFPYPKSLDMMKWIIKKSLKKDCTVLDFFAGSGTTGQAVLEVNKEDGGNRNFILVTNNENKIFDNVTYPRISTVLTGIRVDGTKYSDGLDGNLVSYSCCFIDDCQNKDQSIYNLVEKCNELLCIKENTYIKEYFNKFFYVYRNCEKRVFIYIDFYNEKAIDEMVKKVNNSDLANIVYIFTIGNFVDEYITSMIPKAIVKPIPSKIYEIYKEIVEDIKRGF